MYMPTVVNTSMMIDAVCVYWSWTAPHQCPTITVKKEPTGSASIRSSWNLVEACVATIITCVHLYPEITRYPQSCLCICPIVQENSWWSIVCWCHSPQKQFRSSLCCSSSYSASSPAPSKYNFTEVFHGFTLCFYHIGGYPTSICFEPSFDSWSLSSCS